MVKNYSNRHCGYGWVNGRLAPYYHELTINLFGYVGDVIDTVEVGEEVVARSDVCGIQLDGYAEIEVVAVVVDIVGGIAVLGQVDPHTDRNLVRYLERTGTLGKRGSGIDMLIDADIDVCTRNHRECLGETLIGVAADTHRHLQFLGVCIERIEADRVDEIIGDNLEITLGIAREGHRDGIIAETGTERMEIDEPEGILTVVEGKVIVARKEELGKRTVLVDTDGCASVVFAEAFLYRLENRLVAIEDIGFALISNMTRKTALGTIVVVVFAGGEA